MKKICFPSTDRVHLSRQKLLLDELSKDFDVVIHEAPKEFKEPLNNVADLANYFGKVFREENYDLVLIRGDRYEVLPIAMLACYNKLKIAHIEGGDLSGTWDNKVRYAITALSDLHFATNQESWKRLIGMGTNPDLTYNLGSLDVEYAGSIDTKYEGEPFILMCHHPLEGENPELIENLIKEQWQGRVIVIKSNADNKTTYGKEEYPPEEYIKLLANAQCLVGNSSSFIKEASAFGTPVTLIGDRQKNRLLPDNVDKVRFDEKEIRASLQFQIGNRYKPSDVYYKPNTSKAMVEKIKEFLE